MPGKITIGSDPELFLFNPRTKRFKSSVGLIGGSKAHPRPFGDKQGFCVQEDNVAVEFNTPPVSDLQEFVSGIDYSINYIRSHVDKLGLEVRLDAAAYFPLEELMTEEAQTFGCDPDFNAWTHKRNRSPKSEEQQLRSCGGHIHVGEDPVEMNPMAVARMMDLYLGVPSVLMDKDILRKKLYGKAGACRVKPYGVEYRVLSNFWLQRKELQQWAFVQTLRAVQQVRSGMSLDEDGLAIQAAINNADEDLASMLIARHNLAVV